MERNQNGYPTKNSAQEPVREQCPMGAKCNIGCGFDSACIGSMPIAYAYVPIQKFRMLYKTDKALERGTLFEELDLPLEVYKNGK